MILRKFFWFLSIVLCFGLINVSAQTETPKMISGGIINGKATSLPKPEYPPAARAVKAGGTVNVEVIIDEQGNVESANAVSGHPLLRAAAVNAARQAIFAPTQLSGQPVKVKGVIIYMFGSNTDGPVNSSGSAEPKDQVFKIDSTKIDQDKPFKVGSNINGGVVNGKAISLPVPIYPAAAQAAKASGAVNVRVKIDIQGNVVQAEAVSGHPLLQAAAVEAARLSKFKPTLLAGEPVNVTGIIVYNFNLSSPSPITEGLRDENTNWATGMFFAFIREADSNLLKEMEFGEDFDAELKDMMKNMPEEFSSEKESLEKLGNAKGAERQRIAAELGNSFKKFYTGSNLAEYELGQTTGFVIVQIMKKLLVIKGANIQTNDALLKEKLGNLKTLIDSNSLKITPNTIKALREMSDFADSDLSSPENAVKLFELVDKVFENAEIGEYMTDIKVIENQSFENKTKFSIRERLLAAAGILTIFGGSLYVWFFNPTTEGFFPTCPLLTLTGLACPGCGLTRGFHALFHGDFLTALGFNAMLPVYAAIFLYLLISMVLIAARGRGLPMLKIFHPYALSGFLIVSLSFAILRNLPFYPFSVLYP